VETSPISTKLCIMVARTFLVPDQAAVEQDQTRAVIISTSAELASSPGIVHRY